jgi:restriction system protein
MTVPVFQDLTLPVLRASANGDIAMRDVVERLREELRLSDQDASELLPSGRQTRFANRVHWAKAYLGMADLIASTGRGRFTITAEGKKVLAQSPTRIDIKFLEQFPTFRDRRAGAARDDSEEVAEAAPTRATEQSNLTPDDIMRAAERRLRGDLAAELLERILTAPPEFFERLIVRLLIAMGYGGSAVEAARAIGKSGDGGVDGVVDQDALGLDRVYIQAKRYATNNPVGAGAVRDFFGSLDRFKATKGLFVTTSSFTQSARETSDFLSKRIVLIDGVQLTKLMIRYDVGCRIEETLFIKRLDEEFFD